MSLKEQVPKELCWTVHVERSTSKGHIVTSQSQRVEVCTCLSAEYHAADFTQNIQTQFLLWQ